MKLKVLDQIHVSAVQSDSLRPGQRIEVSDAYGAELLARHPAKFAAENGEKAEPAPKNKVEPAPKNKTAPNNKTAPKSAV